MQSKAPSNAQIGGSCDFEDGMPASQIAGKLDDRQRLLVEWDEELLKGGVMLSEWSVFQIRDADASFCVGADLAAVLVAQAAMESHLRYEYTVHDEHAGFAQLIELSPLPPELTSRLHDVRKARNRWVHVRSPGSDTALLEHPDEHRLELSKLAVRAMRLLREVIYQEQWV